MGIGPVIPTQNVFLTSQIWNGIVPAGGLKALRAVADWSTGASFTIDLTLAQQSGQLTNVQSLYMDNSQNDQPATLIVQGTLARYTLPGNWQGVLPILSPIPPVFSVQSSGTGTTVFYFVNAPLPCLTWPGTNATFHFDGSGNLLVSDQALDATISNGAVNTQQLPQVSPYSEAVINFNAAGDTSLIAAPGAGLRLRIYGLEFLTAGATNIIVKSAATVLVGEQDFGANSGKILDPIAFPRYTCGVNEAFIFNCSAAVQIGGRIYYTAAP